MPSLEDGYCVEPAVFEGGNRTRIFQGIFGPVVPVTSATPCAAWAPGSGTRDAETAYQFGCGIRVGRTWVNNYHAYPHARRPHDSHGDP